MNKLLMLIVGLIVLGGVLGYVFINADRGGVMTNDNKPLVDGFLSKNQVSTMLSEQLAQNRCTQYYGNDSSCRVGGKSVLGINLVGTLDIQDVYMEGDSYVVVYEAILTNESGGSTKVNAEMVFTKNGEDWSVAVFDER